jgi:hypothetical protein
VYELFTFSGGTLKHMKTRTKTSPWAEEVEQNLVNGFTLSQQNLANGYTMSQLNLANRMSEPRSMESEFSSETNHR